MKRLNSFLLVLAASLSVAWADAITLKTGEKIEGTITSETATEVTIEYKMSASVTDQKVVPKDQIEKIEKTTPDQVAYEEIKNFKVGQNSLPLASYDRIVTALKDFQAKFPDSPHAGEVRGELEKFEKERERVAGGEMKLDDAWLSKEDAEKQRYQLSGRALYNVMRDQSARGNLIGAMNSFDRLEKDYPGARVYPEAIELARQIVPALQRDIERREQTLKFEKEQLQRTLQMAGEQDRIRIDLGVKREQAQFEAALAQAKKSGLKWPPLIPRSPASVEAIKRMLPAEGKRVADAPAEKIRQSFALADKAREALAAGEVTAAEDALKQARSLWNKNELLPQLDTEMAEAKKAATEVAKQALAAARAAEKPKRAAQAAPKPEAQPEPEKKSWFLTIPGALTILLAVVVIFGVSTLISRNREAKANRDQVE